MSLFHQNTSGSIAKDRLKRMIETENLNRSYEDTTQLKKEISALVGRYFNTSPDMFEIKITLKQNKKREQNV